VGGTDSPVVPVNPFWYLFISSTATRCRTASYGENERVTSRVDLLRMITINYAKLTGEADIKAQSNPASSPDFCSALGGSARGSRRKHPTNESARDLLEAGKSIANRLIDNPEGNSV